MSLVATDISDSNLNLKTSNAWNQIDFTWNAVNLANIPLIFENSKHVQQEKHERNITREEFLSVFLSGVLQEFLMTFFLLVHPNGHVIYQLSQKMYEMR